MTHGHEISAGMREAILNCEECHGICTEITVYSVRQGGNYADPDHVGLLLDCAQMCALSADFMLRLSHYNGRVCDVCSAICRRCADSCERVGPADTEDEAMRRCVPALRRIVPADGRGRHVSAQDGRAITYGLVGRLRMRRYAGRC